jgi:ABC-type multidrug transport system fused ATPase/permease subunit
MPAFVRIMNTLQNFRFGHDAIETVYDDLMSLAAGRRRIASPKPIEGDVAGDIVVRDASFAYAGTSTVALSDVNLEVRAGEALALVGPSGAGKTTLADVILGLHRLDQGTLAINGICYADPTQIPRGVFGYVPQDPFLIDDTIVRNIALGVPDADIDQRRIDDALKAASLDGFVAGLPGGQQTMVGDRGVRLSGGQRQRIGIARALYGNPKFLVLDEATSSVDATTEVEITEAINRLRGIKTLIVVAHRLSTVRECDRIVLLEKGRIVGVGTYDDLLKRSAMFAAMVAHLDHQSLQPQASD